MVLAAYLLGLSSILVSQAGNTSIAVRTEPFRPLVGGNVTFIPVGSMENISLCRWYRGPTRKKNKIMTYQTFPILGISYSNAYTGREQIQLDCSLSITNLTFRDTGFYIVLKKRTVHNVYEKGKVLLQIKDSSRKNVQVRNVTGKETAGIVVGSLLGFTILVGLFSYHKLNSAPRHVIEPYAL